MGLTNGLLAHYRFEGSGADAAGRSTGFELKNTSFQQGTLFLNGGYEHGGLAGGFRAVAAVPGFSYEAFTVSLDFWPVDFKSDDGGRRRVKELLSRIPLRMFRDDSENSHDPILMGGPSYRWFGFRQINRGDLELTLNNQGYIHTFAKTSISTRRWHHLICSVDLKRRLILTLLDGQALEPVKLPENFKLDIMSAPEAATDKEFTFSNYGRGSAFHGFADNLRVFGRALDAGEMAALYVGTKGERPAFQPSINVPEETESTIIGWVSLLVMGGAAAWLFWWRRRRLARRRTV